MKELRKALVCVALLGLVASYAYATVVTDGLVAWWKFDDQSNIGKDSGTNGLNGTPNNVTLVTDTPGAASSYAATFNGTSSCVSIGDNSSLNLTSGITLEVWIKPNTDSGYRTFLRKNNQYLFRQYGIQLQGMIYETGYRSIVNDCIVKDVWQHLVFTYDGAKFVLYAGGEEIYSYNYSSTISTSTNYLTIGANDADNDGLGNSEFYSGLMDDVRIYNRALTATEVEQNYSAIPEPTTIALLLLGGVIGPYMRKR